MSLRWSQRVKLALVVISLILVAVILVQAGLWRRSVQLDGPFRRTAGETGLLAIDLAATLPVRGVLRTGGDNLDDPARSRLQLWVDGLPFDRPHVAHDALRAGAPGGFSHWRDTLNLSLAGDEGWPGRIRVVYEVEIAPAALVAVVVSWLLAFILWIAQALRAVRLPRIAVQNGGRPFQMHRRLLQGWASAAWDSPWLMRWTGLILLLTSIALAASVLLQVGLWQRSLELDGFRTGQSDGGLTIIDLRPTLPLPWLLDTGGDTLDAPTRSRLKLAVDGEPFDRPHMSHDALRAGTPAAFSHWQDSLYISALPVSAPGTRRISVAYAVQLAPMSQAVLLGAWLLAAILRIMPAIRRRRLHPAFVGAGLGFLLLAEAVAYLTVLMASAYLGVTGWAWLDGRHAIPAAAAFGIAPAVFMAADALTWLPHILVFVAVCGCLLDWLAHAGLIPPSTLAGSYRRTARLWSGAAIPVVFALFLFWAASGGWADRFQPFELQYMAVAGLVPNSDALAYFVSAFNLLSTGAWNTIAAQRPVASAMRDLLLSAAGYSYLGFIHLQILLISLCSIAAAWSVWRWKGPWAALAFFGLSFGLTRTFANTAMTEPIGAIWALISLTFFIEAMRRRAAGLALIAFAAFMLAMLSRMGSMFAIPMVLIWIVLGFAAGKRRRGILLLQTLGVAALVVGLNAAVAAIASPAGAQVGGNFSYVACGLARGTDWSECFRTFRNEVIRIEDAGGSASEVSSFIMSQAVFSFHENPTKLWEGLQRNARAYLDGMPDLLFGLYGREPLLRISQSAFYLFFAVLAAGLLFPYLMRRSFLEVGFWASILLGSIASASIIYSDDGARTLHVTNIFISCLFSVALASRLPCERNLVTTGNLVRGGALGVTVMASLMVANSLSLRERVRGGSLPPVLWSAGINRSLFSPERDRVDLALGGCTGWSGFIVADGTGGVAPGVVTLRPSTFREIVGRSNLAGELKVLIDDDRWPKAFISAPYTAGATPSWITLVGPPDILIDCDRPDRVARGRWIGQLFYVEGIRLPGQTETAPEPGQ